MREWWINTETYKAYDHVCLSGVHVVEAAALEQEVMRIEGVLKAKYEKHIAELDATIRRRENEIRYLRQKASPVETTFACHMGMFDDEGTVK